MTYDLIEPMAVGCDEDRPLCNVGLDMNGHEMPAGLIGSSGRENGEQGLCQRRRVDRMKVPRRGREFGPDRRISACHLDRASRCADFDLQPFLADPDFVSGRDLSALINSLA
jgi:hypothetical protein